MDRTERSLPPRDRGAGQSRPTSAGNGRIPPHNLQAEESVLGAILLSRDALGSVIEAGLRYDDFYKPAHQHVFDVAVAVSQSGGPVDTITVADELSRLGLLDQVGGVEALHGLQNATPAISNAASYARIVQDAALLRRLIHVAADISEIGYSRPDNVDDALDDAETRVFRVADRRVTDSYRDIGELMKLAVDRIEENFARGDTITGTPTGYNDLDELLSGLQPSTLNIVGARPAMGKTAFGLGLATHVAKNAGRPVLVFSLEMGHVELTQRILASEAEVDSTKIRNGRLSEADWAKIGRAIGRLEVPLFLDDNPRVTVMEIRAKARRLKMQHGDLGLVLIDYLQLMSGHGNSENRQLEVSEISRNLKILARELEVPIVALSQLSRNLETRSDKRPMLSDLRESGCLTADTRLLRADSNAEVTLGELVESGATDVPVWSLDDRFRLVPALLTHAFASGVKPTFRMRLASGRTIDATANHRFRTVTGWIPLGDLCAGSRIAVPRLIDSPDDLTALDADEVVRLAQLTMRDCGSPETVVPDRVFALPVDQVALFLRHLWAAGGSPTPGALQAERHTRLSVRLCFSSSSRRLVDGVQQLLLRLGIQGRIDTVAAGSHPPAHHLHIEGPAADPDTDTIPTEVGARILAATERAGISDCNLSFCRDGLERIATAVGDKDLHDLATSDVLWDRIVAIEPLGSMPVFDATVQSTHSFVANGIVAHNSLEQDADVVMFLYRDEVYNPESSERGAADVIVAKHRAGPTGTMRLVFRGQYARFDNAAPRGMA